MPFSFPILEKRDIVLNLAELDINISENDLTKPTSDTTRPIFEQIVHILTGITREEIQQPAFSAMNVLEFPELHDDSISQLAFLRAISRLMHSSGVNDFTMKDLHKPESSRVIRHLSAIINFAKFREEKNLAFQEYQDNSDSIIERKQEVEQYNFMLVNQLKEMENQRQEQQPVVEALEVETKELAETISGLNKQQAAIQGEVRSLKQEANDLSDKVASEKFLLLNAKNEADQLQSQVVESPEKLQKSLEELNISLEKERTLINEAERKTRELQGKLDCSTKAEKEVQKCHTLMQLAEEEILNYKRISKEAKELKNSISTNEKKLNVVSAEIDHLKRQTQVIGERMERLEQQTFLKKSTYLKSLEEAKVKAQEASKQLDNGLSLLDQKRKHVKDLMEKIAFTKESHHREMVMSNAQFEALFKQVTQYHLTLAQVMKDPLFVG